MNQNFSDKPLIECGHGRLAVSINTEKEPPSHVFAKGHFNRPECSFRNTTHVVFDFEKCDVIRKREVGEGCVSPAVSLVIGFFELLRSFRLPELPSGSTLTVRAPKLLY